MFDTRIVGKKIMELRKKGNFTQMDLANKLCVSFQAVSNWERGNSMPDISKLPELAECFNVSVDFLLGSSSETEIVKEIIIDNSFSDISGLKDIAPLLKPNEIDKMLEDIINANGLKDLNEIAHLAPFISSDYLNKLVCTFDLNEEDVNIVALAPFLSEETLKTISVDLFKNEGLNKLTAIAPFFEGGYLDELVISKIANVDTSFCGLFPFLSSDINEKIAREMIKKEKYQELSSILPFLKRSFIDECLESENLDKAIFLPFTSREKLENLLTEAFENGDFSSVAIYLPFVNSDALDDLVLKNLDKDLQFEIFYPFIKRQTLKVIADRLVNEKGIKALTAIAPFL